MRTLDAKEKTLLESMRAHLGDDVEMTLIGDHVSFFFELESHDYGEPGAATLVFKLLTTETEEL